MPHKPTDIRILDAVLTVADCPFRTPLKFRGRVINSAKLMNVTVTVETRSGKRAAGMGSMPAGAAWAWPSAVVAADQAEKAMLTFAEQAVRLTDAYDEYGHPVETMYN